jgi:hypothetical protein
LRLDGLARTGLAIALSAACLPALAMSRHEDVLEDRVQTRAGVLTLRATPQGDHAAVCLQDRKIHDQGPDAARLWLSTVIRTRSRDVVLVFEDTGRIARPGMFVAIDVRPLPRVSQPFGHCSGRYRVEATGEVIDIRMPECIPRPKLLDKAELARRSRQETAYRWRDGVVSERH